MCTAVWSVSTWRQCGSPARRGGSCVAMPREGGLCADTLGGRVRECAAKLDLFSGSSTFPCGRTNLQNKGITHFALRASLPIALSHLPETSLCFHFFFLTRIFSKLSISVFLWVLMRCCVSCCKAMTMMFYCEEGQ